MPPEGRKVQQRQGSGPGRFPRTGRYVGSIFPPLYPFPNHAYEVIWNSATLPAIQQLKEIPMEQILNRHWHTLPSEEAARLLISDTEKGLDLFEVNRRLERFGRNALHQAKGKTPLHRFLLQFHQPLIYILLAAGLITALLGEWVDSGVILGVVLVNAVIGYLQEAKAVKALDALARTMTTEATVLRSG